MDGPPSLHGPHSFVHSLPPHSRLKHRFQGSEWWCWWWLQQYGASQSVIQYHRKYATNCMTTSMFLFLMSSMMMPHADNNVQIMIMVMVMMMMMTMTLVANPTANVGGLQMLQYCHSASIYLVLSFFLHLLKQKKKRWWHFFLSFFV